MLSITGRRPVCAATSSLRTWSCQRMRRICRWHFMWKASSVLTSAASSVHVSDAYNKTAYGNVVKVKIERRISIWRALVLQNGNSYILAVHWVILMIFGMLIDIDLLKKVTSLNPKPEVKMRHSGRHLENRVIRYWWNVSCWRRMTWQLRRWGQDRNWKIWRTENEIAHWLNRYVSPGYYSNVRACVSAGIAQQHNLLNCGTGYAQLPDDFTAMPQKWPTAFA